MRIIKRAILLSVLVMPIFIKAYSIGKEVENNRFINILDIENVEDNSRSKNSFGINKFRTYMISAGILTMIAGTVVLIVGIKKRKTVVGQNQNLDNGNN